MKLTAKQAKAVERLKGLDPANEFFWDDNMIVPKFVKGKLSKASSKASEIKDTAANQQIPDKDPAGIESVINVGRSGTIINLDVSVDINHTWISDLRVTLVAPLMGTIRLGQRDLDTQSMTYLLCNHHYNCSQHPGRNIQHEGQRLRPADLLPPLSHLFLDFLDQAAKGYTINVPS